MVVVEGHGRPGGRVYTKKLEVCRLMLSCQDVFNLMPMRSGVTFINKGSAQGVSVLAVDIEGAVTGRPIVLAQESYSVLRKAAHCCYYMGSCLTISDC